jgi:hypothetical protein
MCPGRDLHERVADEIRRYWIQYPKAADTDDGIQRWWLPPWFEVPLDVVQAALLLLEVGGFAAADPIAGGRVVYRRAAADAADVMRSAGPHSD